MHRGDSSPEYGPKHAMLKQNEELIMWNVAVTWGPVLPMISFTGRIFKVLAETIKSPYGNKLITACYISTAWGGRFEPFYGNDK